MVLLVSGQVPVRNLGRMLSDPAVVKVAPLPREANAADVPARQAGPAPAMRHPVVLLVGVLLVMWISGPALRRRRLS